MFVDLSVFLFLHVQRNIAASFYALRQTFVYFVYITTLYQNENLSWSMSHYFLSIKVNRRINVSRINLEKFINVFLL